MKTDINNLKVAIFDFDGTLFVDDIEENIIMLKDIGVNAILVDDVDSMLNKQQN